MFSTVGWLIWGILTVPAATVVTVVLVRQFKDPGGTVNRLPHDDLDVRRARARAGIMIIPGIWSLAAYSWPGTIDYMAQREWNTARGTSSDWVEVVEAALGFCVALCVVVGLGLYFLNRPKLLIHPCFRGDPGLLRARRLRAEGVDVDALYEASAERWRERQRRRGRTVESPPDGGSG